MIEGFSAVKPWNQGSFYARYFTFVNISIILLDLTFLFGFVPGVLLALFGYFHFVGWLTLLALAVSVVLFSSIYLYQKNLQIPFQHSTIGFLCFLFFFQLIQSSAALHGYVTGICRKEAAWQ